MTTLRQAIVAELHHEFTVAAAEQAMRDVIENHATEAMKSLVADRDRWKAKAEMFLEAIKACDYCVTCIEGTHEMPTGRCEGCSNRGDNWTLNTNRFNLED